MPEPFMNVYGGPEASPYACPCCGYLTLGERGTFEICDVCFWEDDGQDEHDAGVIRGGPNGPLSLTQARENYRTVGACDLRSTKSVRAPRPEEHSDRDWNNHR
ncbi:CPCC family cysteine-rich protein [Streptomyces sp. NPDC017868]|uniref:CPCC family cysteine-rich protein n=1 Tax=Streptomyces sp. NPDC017868 TaxID=3365014 RepID=UPI0037AECE9A